MNTSTLEFHTPDGALVRLLDGACEPAECSGIEAHLASCAECARRLSQLRRRSAAFSALLGDADPEAPEFVPPAPVFPEPPATEPSDIERARARRAQSHRAPAPWLRIAAAAVLLLMVGLAASPLRAYVVDWIREQWAVLVGAPAAAPTVSAPDESPANTETEASTRVRFVPAGNVLILEFPARPASGAIMVAVTTDQRATVETAGGGDVLVLPERVRISGGAGADYRATVPATLRRVEVRIAGETVATFDPAAVGVGGEQVIELAPAAAPLLPGQ